MEKKRRLRAGDADRLTDFVCLTVGIGNKWNLENKRAKYPTDRIGKKGK
jgi:hypothetical protein